MGLNASYYLWGLAHGYAQMGERDTAQQMLDEGFRRAEASEETRMNAELLILRAELAPDDAVARPLLARALRIADEEGAITTSLRAVVALVLRSDSSAEDLETARLTREMLDGRAPYPDQRGWMQERLLRLRRGPDAQIRAAQPS